MYADNYRWAHSINELGDWCCHRPSPCARSYAPPCRGPNSSPKGPKVASQHFMGLASHCQEIEIKELSGLFPPPPSEFCK